MFYKASKRENYNKHSLEYTMECVNCGKIGHTFRDCRNPIMSYGIIAIKMIEDKPHYLLIQRRDSLGYVEFLRGKYRLDAPDYILLLINGMTAEERQRLIQHGFDKLWETLWNNQNTRQYRNEYEIARKQFDTLKNTGDIGGKLLHTFIEQASTVWSTPEWGFPKGRRALHEPEIACATREFQEETGLQKGILHMCTGVEPYIEHYVGTNGISYKQVYFIAACHKDTEASLQTSNRVMTREVGNIGWFPYEEALDHLRSTNVEKRAMFMKLHADIQKGLKERILSALEWVSVTNKYSS